MGAKGAESDDKDTRFGGQFSQMYNTYRSSVYTIQVQFQLRVGLRLLARFYFTKSPREQPKLGSAAFSAGMQLVLSSKYLAHIQLALNQVDCTYHLT